MDRRPAARHGGSRQAGRRPAVAGRARRKGRREIVRSPRRTALCVVRRGRNARRRYLARAPRAQGLQPAHPRDRGCRPQAGARAQSSRQHLAGEEQLECDQRSAVLGLGRKTVRRSAGPGPVVEGLVRGAARPVAQFPVQLSRSQRGQHADQPASRLRRFRLLPARLFCIQDGAAVRLFELLARVRRQAAEVLPVVRRRTSRSHPPGPAAGAGRRRRSRASIACSAAVPRHLAAVQPNGAAPGRCSRGCARPAEAGPAETADQLQRVSA